MFTSKLETIESLNVAGKAGGVRRPEVGRIITAIDHLCAPLEIGDRIPTHTDLMRQLQASERTVLRALDELQRQGRIVRRHGAGTFIARKSGVGSLTEQIPSVRALVAIANPDHSFFDHAIELLYAHARDEDLSLVCCLLSQDKDQAAILSGIAPAEGYVVFNQRYAGVAQRLQERGDKVVIIGAPPAGVLLGVPNVHGDHERGGFLAVNHLIDLGHRRLAFFGEDPHITNNLRWGGMQLAQRQASKSGLPVTIDVRSGADLTELLTDSIRLNSYFSGPYAPTGVLTWNDNEARKALAAIQGAGLNVPGDISLIGYDALPDDRSVSVRLTTVDGNIHEQLSAAVRILTRDVTVPRHYTVVATPTLIVKDSTASPRF